jgi:hypothetical protein
VNQGTIVFRNSNTVDEYQTFAGSSLPNDIVNRMLTPAGFINGDSGSYNTQTAIVDPPAAIADPVSSWASVATYGAQTSADFTDINDSVSSVVDATTGIQAAMNSGNSTIYFPHGVYYISSPITIPATVQRIVGLDSTLHPIPYENWRTEGMFRILADASTPLTIEQLRFDNSNDGNQLALEQASNRTVVVRNVLFPGTLAVNRASSGGPLFMEDVSAAGSNVTLAGSATFEARQFDFENCGTCAYLSGVPSVLIGFKEEGNVTEESRQPHHCAGTKRHRHVDSDAPKQLGPVCIFCLQRWIDGAIVQLCAIFGDTGGWGTVHAECSRRTWSCGSENLPCSTSLGWRGAIALFLIMETKKRPVEMDASSGAHSFYAVAERLRKWIQQSRQPSANHAYCDPDSNIGQLAAYVAANCDP